MPDNRRHAHHTVTGLKTLRRASARLRARALLSFLVAVGSASGLQRAHALELGDIEARSLLGEPFAVRIPLQFAADEDIGLQCIRLLPHPDAAQGMPLPPGLHIDIEATGSKQWIAIRGPALVTDLVVGLRIEIDCNKQLARDFVVLLNPAPIQLAALQVGSPPASGQQSATIMPDARPAGGGASARQKRGDVGPRASRRATAPTRSAGAALPAADKAKHTPDDRPGIAQSSARKGARTRRAGVHAGEPVLRIDARPVNRSRGEGTPEAQRELLRAMARLNVQFDDSTAAQLDMNNRIQQLEKSLAVLRSTFEQQQAAAAQVPVPVAVAAPMWEVIGHEAADAMPWLIGGTLALLGLSGSMLWRRRRKPASATALEPAASGPTELERWVPDTADTGEFHTVPATRVAPLHPAGAPAPVLPQMTPPLPAAPPVLIDSAAAAPITVRDAGVPPSRPPRQATPEFSPPRAVPAPTAQEEYYAGRFGGHSEDIRVLHDLDTVIEQARSIYQDDGDAIKAADLLELTVELHPAVVWAWLALFAIYRRESMARQYALLAQKFSARFAADPNWPMVQQLGREIDADNVLYGALLSAKDADAAPANSAVEQDVTDEWLGVQLDFNSSLLATELRERLVSAAAGAPPLAATAG